MGNHVINDEAKKDPELAARNANMLISAVLVGVGLGLILLYGINHFEGQISAGSGLEEAPLRGSLAPNFSLKNLQGEDVELAEYRGRVVLINFWATWCAPCRLEMPAIQARYERYSPDLAVLAVDFDEPEQLVRDFVTEFGMTFEVLLDPGAVVQDQYQIRGYPSSYFVDEDGIIQFVHIGIMTDSQLDGYLGEMGVSN